MTPNEVTATEYAEHTDDPATWASPRPDFDMDRFNRELAKRVGMCHDVRPWCRLVWGGEREEYLIEEFEVVEGYDYWVDGKKFYVSKDRGDFELPDNAAIVTPRVSIHKAYTPRWIIEEYKIEDPLMPYAYHKAWTVETVEIVGKKSGLVSLLSRYREPSEIDLFRCQKLRYLREHTTEDQIRDGVAAQMALHERRKKHERDEFIGEIAEEAAKALTDGLPNEEKYNFDPKLQFDINEFTKEKIREHDRRYE